ncbi:hypothetical protein SAMN05444678_110133 [Sphingomonas sp. YR710]|nr:hypothetical protein SAMN05444678_110133 [Sphingomonas sp. YR710]
MALHRMESNQADLLAPRGAVDIIGALLRADGGAHHPYMAGEIFAAGRDLPRNLADAVHYLCTLHGDHPGIIDLARDKGGFGPAAEWLDDAASGFAQERLYLTKVVVAAGPLPSTAGQADSAAAVAGQRHALEMLARSDRTGCAIGAGLALALDWRAIRTVIDAAAQRFGVELTPPALPSSRATMMVAAAAAGSVSIERAMIFGAQQMLVQHRGLWDLLHARQLARVGQ